MRACSWLNCPRAACSLTHRSVHSCRMLLRLLWDTRASASSASTFARSWEAAEVACNASSSAEACLLRAACRPASRSASCCRICARNSSKSAFWPRMSCNSQWWCWRVDSSSSSSASARVMACRTRSSTLARTSSNHGPRCFSAAWRSCSFSWFAAASSASAFLRFIKNTRLSAVSFATVSWCRSALLLALAASALTPSNEATALSRACSASAAATFASSALCRNLASSL
mmetsp:Transcript_310/g.727  ORF Transcript_310/g.727 Transcript_310/m.727 type:complete len:230 (+) Transcript_310:1776-2465(+)